jgi:uncharacterized membrane protein
MAFCSNCGAAVEGRFCPKCGSAVDAGAAAGGPGAPPPASPPPGYTPPQGYNPPPGGPPPPGYSAPGYSAPGGYVPPPTAAAGMTDNMAGALCYLFGFITGILVLVLAPYNQNRNIKFHALQSIFLNIAWIVTWIAATIVSIALHAIPILGAIISILLHAAIGIGFFIVWLYMMFKTYNGEKIVLPIIGPMAEKQAAA